MIKIVVFDAFNTIVKRNKKFVTEPYKLVTSRATKDLFNPMSTNLSVREYADAIGAGYSDEEWTKIENDLALELSKIVVFPETIGVMKSLKNNGYKIAIASNLAPAYGPYLKETFSEYVDEFYFSYEMGLSKPDPKYYEFIMEDCKIKYGFDHPKQYYMVGDSEKNDFLAPVEAGWLAALLDRSGRIPFSISRLNTVFVDLQYQTR
jgi:HAD superfamily hydrolase (TIGR01549 family)